MNQFKMLYSISFLVHSFLIVLSKDDELDLNTTFFHKLTNYQVNARHAKIQQYPWVAQIIHSRRNNYPYVCTASCIGSQEFITAASCISLLKVRLTTVIYRTLRLTVKAFVLPTNVSKQEFNDIGFVITMNKEYKGDWHTVQYNWHTSIKDPQTDKKFKWFEKAPFISLPFKAIGYASEKRILGMPNTVDYALTELDIVLDIKLCHNILTHDKLNGFHVPCYHSCTYKQFMEDDDKCKNYHGVEGGAIYCPKDKRLYGIATWGTECKEYELPVGFSIPSAITFAKDRTCAEIIKNDNLKNAPAGYYQRLCDDHDANMK